MAGSSENVMYRDSKASGVVTEKAVAWAIREDKLKAKPNNEYTIGSAGLRSHSKILTAGELNDFKKWKLWNGYSGEDFKDGANTGNCRL